MLQPYANWDFDVAKGVYLEISCECFNQSTQLFCLDIDLCMYEKHVLMQPLEEGIQVSAHQRKQG